MKKQWISVKCGLSRDPKHRRQMGKAIWTFLHMLDMADWETGMVYDWKDEAAAEDMGIDIRVLREERRRLEQEGYINCRQKQYGQDITINNWTNPREYTGEVYNKKQGGKKTVPSVTESVQGDAQGDVQGSIKDVTPTYNSNIKESNIKEERVPQIVFDKANKEVDYILGGLSPKAIQDAVATYFKLTPNWETKYARQWMQWAMNGAGVTSEKIEVAADRWRRDKLFNWSVPTLKGIQEHWLELINSTSAHAQEPKGFQAVREFLEMNGVTNG